MFMHFGPFRSFAMEIFVRSVVCMIAIMVSSALIELPY